MKKTLLAAGFVLSFISCKKNHDECKDYSGFKRGFESYEYVLDTLLRTDTSFADRNILFKTNEPYNNITWKIGSDPRTFTSQSVNLRFSNPEILNVILKGNAINSNCISENFTSTKPFVLIENNGSIQSPLVGIYRGYNIDNANEIFSVAIKFWIGSRYNWWSNGAYSVENLPNGYLDTTKNFNGYSRPEIKGIIASTGYKNIAIDESGSLPSLGIKGYGNLSRGVKDTLIFNYTIIDTAQLNSTGQLKYLVKKFIGIKN